MWLVRLSAFDILYTCHYCITKGWILAQRFRTVKRSLNSPAALSTLQPPWLVVIFSLLYVRLLETVNCGFNRGARGMGGETWPDIESPIAPIYPRPTQSTQPRTQPCDSSPPLYRLHQLRFWNTVCIYV